MTTTTAPVAPTFTVYEILGHSDQTEGRGGITRVCATVATLDAALARVSDPDFIRRYGLYDRAEFRIIEVVHTVTSDEGVEITRVPIWGARSDSRGERGNGFLDLRDDPDADPEYAEYARLAIKFGRSL